MSNVMLKAKMDGKQMVMVSSEFDKRKKSKGIAYALWWFLGWTGAHRFYAGDKGYGLFILLCGWITLFILPLIDGFFIGKRIDKRNEAIELEIINEVSRFAKEDV